MADLRAGAVRSSTPVHIEAAGVTPPARRYRFTARATLFVDHAAGTGVSVGGRRWTGPPAPALGDLLTSLPPEVERVVLCGPLPWGEVADLRAWLHVELPAPWRVHERGHRVGRYQSPILRFERDGQAVEMLTAAGWFGPTVVDGAAVIRDAFGALGRVLDETLGMSAWLTTPATTGTNAWHRTVPEQGWPILPESLRDELRTLVPQARIETFEFAGDQLPHLVEVDARFAYGALVRAAPGGLPYRAKGPGDLDAERYLPAMYRVRYRVPPLWPHVGILPVRTEDGWSWPVEGAGETWCSGAELHVALNHGWRCQVLERIVWPKGGGEPLRTFGERIQRARATIATEVAAGLVDERAGDLARGGLRRMLTDTIGRFAGGMGYTVERWATWDEAEAPENAVRIRTEGEGVAWEEQVANEHADQLAHPEYAHAVWARCRARMLDGPGGTGALYVDRRQLLGIGTDALYLAGDVPPWALGVDAGGLDDGKDGRLRHKATHHGPLSAPHGRSQLLALLGQLRAAGGAS